MTSESASNDLLCHADLRWHIAHVRSSTKDVIASWLFDDFADAAGQHLAVVERRLLPLLKDDCNAAYYVDLHQSLKRALFELRHADRGSDAFVQRLAAFCIRLERQMMTEATRLLPLLADRLLECNEAALEGRHQSGWMHRPRSAG